MGFFRDRMFYKFFLVQLRSTKDTCLENEIFTEFYYLLQNRTVKEKRQQHQGGTVQLENDLLSLIGCTVSQSATNGSTSSVGLP